ncbi:M28 family metallopeptidase [Pseudoalteromonas xiamenensis]
MRSLQPLTIGLLFSLTSLNVYAQKNVGWEAMVDLASQFSNRVGGTEEEAKAAQWLVEQYQQLGYQAQVDEFQFQLGEKTLTTRNLEVEIKGKSEDVLIIGAHYDSVPSREGSSGFTDNASGAATLIGIAHNLVGKTPHYTIRLVSFGAEEMGLHGSIHYVSAKQASLGKVVGMINLDTVIGGDNLYIHSAHTVPYACDRYNGSEFNSSKSLRDTLLVDAANIKTIQYDLHPKTADYPEGETGEWSDHAPFACNGIPTVYIEATNFTLYGKDGYDGYSQTAEAKFWTCYDKATLGACDRNEEKKWGQIWHTPYDSHAQMVGDLKEKIALQFDANVELLSNYVIKKSL